MKTNTYAKELLQLVEEGTSPFHVTASVERQLVKAGFTKLSMRHDWSLDNGGRYYVVHNDSSLIAFTVGKRLQFGDSFRIAAAHTDFPGLRVKPSPEIVKDGYRQLNVEVYGGAILNTWLDRPLSAAGRVVLRKDDIFHPEVRLVDFRKPFLTIPNLAIHINRDVNKGVELNKQTDMLPVLGLEGEETDEKFFLKHLAGELKVDPEDILEYELGLYNTDTGDFLGLSEEFISAPRLDNLTSVQAVVSGLISGERENGFNVGAFFDHEEIRSRGPARCFCRRFWSGFSCPMGEGGRSFLRAFRRVCFCRWMWGMGFIRIRRIRMIPQIRIFWEREFVLRRPADRLMLRTVRLWRWCSRFVRRKGFLIRSL